MQECVAFLSYAMAASGFIDAVGGNDVTVVGAEIDGDEAIVSDFQVEGEELRDNTFSIVRLELIDGVWYVSDF
jgi:hypothetical protein